jgi:hypothetical protein
MVAGFQAGILADCHLKLRCALCHWCGSSSSDGECLLPGTRARLGGRAADNLVQRKPENHSTQVGQRCRLSPFPDKATADSGAPEHIQLLP